MPRLAILVTLLGSFAASAQPVTIRSSASVSNDTVLFGAADCNSTLTLQWTATTLIGTPPNGPLKLWASTGECGDAPAATGDISFDDIPPYTFMTLKSGTFLVKLSDLPSFHTGTTLADGGTSGTACGTLGITSTNKICGSFTYTTGIYGGTNTVSRASPLKLDYDTQPPSAPTITAVTALDGSARLSFSIDSDTATIIGQVKGPSDADYVNRGEATSSATSLRMTGLVNDTEYQVRLIAYDLASNQSVPSDPMTVTPIKTIGFFGAYRDSGGTDQAGCNAVPAAMPVLGLLLGASAWLARRRSNR